MMDYLFLLPVCFLVLSVVLATRAVKRGTKTKKAVAVQLVSFLVVTLFCFGVPMVAQAADASTAAAAASSANGMGLIAAAEESPWPLPLPPQSALPLRIPRPSARR